MEEQKKDWAEMSDGEEPEAEAKEEEKSHTIKKKQKVPAAKKGFKNDRGDYVVTSINIPDTRTGVNKEKKEKEDDDDSDSDTSYGDEDDAKEEVKKTEEPKKEGKFHFIFLIYDLIEKPAK